jgi:DNA helicase II / ATP-dependent DNA helicase PcrA
MAVDDLLKGLTDPQREAVTHGAGPLLVLAGPGSGKTRVITHRAAYLARTVTQPWHILAITFTNKAANEMAERIDRLADRAGITCSTFHSFCARLLRMYADRAGLQPNFSIFDDSDQTAAMKTAIDRCNLSVENFTPGKMLNIVGRAKNDMVTPEEMEKAGGGWQEKVITRAYAAYEGVLAENNAVDFDDLLLRVAWMLRDHADIRERLGQRYQYVLVDEYQDTNHAQYMIACLLAAQHKNLCVTGDPDQSIYAWRGANLHNILQFEEDFPSAKVVRLEQNYRSTPQILRCADALIANNLKRKKKTLWTHNPAGPGVTVAECEDQVAEAQYIASQIRRHVAAGGRYSDVAVFYRVNSLSRVIEGGMRGAQIPYQVARGVAFYNRKEIRDVIAYLKVVANPRDQVSLERIIGVPPRGIGKTTVDRLLAHAAATGRTALEVLAHPEEIPGAGRAVRALQVFAKFMADLKALADKGNVQDTMEFAVRNGGLLAMWNAAGDEDAIDNVNELISAAAEYDRQHVSGAPAAPAEAAVAPVASAPRGGRPAPDARAVSAESDAPLFHAPLFHMINPVEPLPAPLASAGADGALSGDGEAGGVGVDDGWRSSPDPTPGSLADYLTQVSLVSDLDAIDAETGAVTLMTLHAAKGLEFDNVFIAGLEQGLLPHQRSEAERADIEEERRLCFVGMTRARKALTLSCSRWRDFRGMTNRTSRSQFLAELPTDEVNWVRVGENGESDYDDGDEQESPVSPPPASSSNWASWGRGQLVRHGEFGLGHVMWIQPRGGRTHAGVQFRCGEKTLVLEFAKLEVVEPDELD